MMETPANINVPIFERKQNGYANVSSIFTEFNSLFPTLEIEKPKNTQQYRIVRNSEAITLVDLEENQLNFSDASSSVLKDSTETTTFDTVFSKSVIEDLVDDEEEDFDDSFFYGVQVIEHPQKIIFSQEVELKLNELERWRPHITIDSFLLDDDE